MKEGRSKLEAWENLFALFTETGNTQPNPQRMLSAISAYRKLDIKATSEGLKEEKRENFILEGLMVDALIDPEDKDKASEQLKIIKKGYQADPAHWDKWIGRKRRYLMDVREMQRELGER